MEYSGIHFVVFQFPLPLRICSFVLRRDSQHISQISPASRSPKPLNTSAVQLRFATAEEKLRWPVLGGAESLALQTTFNPQMGT